MLISSLFLSYILLSIQSATCSDLQPDSSSVNEKSPKQISAETNKYGFHHPPLPEANDRKESRKEKSLGVTDQNPSLIGRSRSRLIRRRPATRPPNLEIPVQVIYDTEPTTVRSYTNISKSTTSPLDTTTRRFSQRRRPQHNKKIDIRQTTIDTSNTNEYKVTEVAQAITDKEKNNVSSTTEFPKRSRGAYFKKRTEPPAPKVKILEEKNFVFSHSGNFHYSFLGGDGTKISSEGSLRSYDNNKTGEAVSGNVFYKDNEGNDYSLSYTADENGYRPVGAHLPTPPPLPPAIARALKYIADKSTQSPLAKSEKE